MGLFGSSDPVEKAFNKWQKLEVQYWEHCRVLEMKRLRLLQKGLTLSDTFQKLAGVSERNLYLHRESRDAEMAFHRACRESDTDSYDYEHAHPKFSSAIQKATDEWRSFKDQCDEIE